MNKELKHEAQKSYGKWITLGLIVIFLAASFLFPPLRTWLSRTFAALGSADVDQVIELIRSYGAWAAAVSFVLMILQSLAAPIPAFLITLANAAIFGWWQGAILSWTSAMVGAALCFIIARSLGRDTVVKLIGETSMSATENFFAQYGKHTILVARLLPFVSFDAVSYIAGLTSIGFWGFFIATGIGQLPATIVYSYVGGVLTGGLKFFVYGLTSLFAFAVILFVAKEIYKSRNKPTENVFFPGCSLLELDTSLIHKVLNTLRNEVPDMELSTLCCGYPAKYSKTEQAYRKKVAKIHKSYERRGVKRIYSACPNCLKLLPEMEKYEILPIWDILLRNFEGSAADASKTWALHDPCPTRSDTQAQERVRELLAKTGIDFKEFDHNKENTRCCGQAHMLHRRNAQKSEDLRRQRAEESPSDHVTSYCQGCMNALSKEELETAHILELLYGPSKRKSWLNRYRTRYFSFGITQKESESKGEARE